jgi:hypothetical protein
MKQLVNLNKADVSHDSQAITFTTFIKYPVAVQTVERERDRKQQGAGKPIRADCTAHDPLLRSYKGTCLPNMSAPAAAAASKRSIAYSAAASQMHLHLQTN